MRWTLLALADLFVINRPHTQMWWSTSPCATISPATRAMCDATARSATQTGPTSSCVNKSNNGVRGCGTRSAVRTTSEDAVVVFARSCGSVCNKQPLYQLLDQAAADKIRNYREPAMAPAAPLAGAGVHGGPEYNSWPCCSGRNTMHYRRQQRHSCRQ